MTENRYGKKNSIPLGMQIFLTLLIVLGVVMGGTVVWLFLILLGVPQFPQYVVGAGVLSAAGFFLCKIWGWGVPRNVNLSFAAAFGVVILAGACYGLYNWYTEGIPVVESEVDLTEYQPFQEENRLVAPEGEASLRLESDLPRLDGATALYPVYAAVAEAVYPRGDYPFYEGPVQCGKTDGAYDRLIAGEADLIFAAGPSDAQLQAAQALGEELELTPIGREAFVFFVNGKNPVENLTLEQIRGIYSGRITNWKDLGGRNEPIRAFQRPENSGSQTALQRLMGDTPLMEPLEEEVVSGMGGILKKTSDYKNFGNAIGYSFRFYASEMAAQDQIRFLRLEGIYPERETVRDGSYPVSSEFYAVTLRGRETENTLRLREWLLSAEGQRLIERSGYLPLR